MVRTKENRSWLRGEINWKNRHLHLNLAIRRPYEESELGRRNSIQSLAHQSYSTEVPFLPPRRESRELSHSSVIIRVARTPQEGVQDTFNGHVTPPADKGINHLCSRFLLAAESPAARILQLGFNSNGQHRRAYSLGFRCNGETWYLRRSTQQGEAGNRVQFYPVVVATWLGDLKNSCSAFVQLITCSLVSIGLFIQLRHLQERWSR